MRYTMSGAIVSRSTVMCECLRLFATIQLYYGKRDILFTKCCVMIVGDDKLLHLSDGNNKNKLNYYINGIDFMVY